MWLEEVVNRMRAATGDYLVRDLCRLIGEYIRQQLYLIGGSSKAVVWDGLDTMTMFQCPTQRPYPFVFVGPDETIFLCGMLPSCQTPVRAEFCTVWRFSQLTRKWNDESARMSVFNRLQVARPPQTTADHFSVFSFSTAKDRSSEFIKLHGQSDSEIIIDIPIPPDDLRDTVAPVYDERNDTIWTLAKTDHLLSYDIRRQVWNSAVLPTKWRQAWAQLCMSSCTNALYVVGGYKDADMIVDEFDIATGRWKTVNIQDVPVHIPAHLLLKHPQLAEWNQQDIFPHVITVYDGEILFIGRNGRKDGNRKTLTVSENISFRSIVSYNPRTHRRQLRAILPIILDEFSPLVI